MGLPLHQFSEPVRDRLVELNGIAGLVLFGVIVGFLCWLKYRDRNNSTKTKLRKRSKQKSRKK